ncbi:elongation factor 1-alpha [Ziziphus jujuba]|uniref:Elongation factor 1-alpha n=2 Tax=Ziziphus jujuba TaxID=326968 RepID=A0ABM4A5E3_ZIZJJ|nr:elongation factor 1-alpha [Ziziphus jujuba]XP_048334119.1 elongation factor 1-alpha [Ziziphus jujuba]XP_048334120.1 elongation factor 1-alpha [Ziziphus jujuba]XP_048334121.1 elongation factor 1-alpha [Ziziphus jujuba]XP_060671951.1 elongation factor 1-alpha [Ziziphus jujuba]KAH7521733.1 hypothetical protein FEM48_Zijuj07G0063900 [Ziziphus jujuba var. spinosa]
MGSEKAKRYIMVIGPITAEMNETLLENAKAVQGEAFEKDKYQCILVYAPGHPYFNENMIKGILQAGCAILTVDSTVSSFEVGTSMNGETYELPGQTYKHAYLAHMLCIKQIICCVDKMDATNPDYSKERYDKVVKSTSSSLGKIGFDQASIYFVPIPGSEGNNLAGTSPNPFWHRVPTLLQALNQIELPDRHFDKPLRLPIEYAEVSGKNYTMVTGCLETGSLKAGQEVILAPTRHKGKVKYIYVDDKPVQEASAGDSVRCNLKNIDAKVLKAVCVASDSKDDPAKEAIRFTSNIIITANYRGATFFEGYTPIIDFGGYHGAVKFEKFLLRIDPTSGEYELGPKLLQKGDAATVEMVPLKPMIVEPFAEYPPLGRFVIRNNKRIVGVGVVAGVEKTNDPNNERERTKSAFKKLAELFGPALLAVGINLAGALANI